MKQISDIYECGAVDNSLSKRKYGKIPECNKSQYNQHML